jgi:hypothetical protein
LFVNNAFDDESMKKKSPAWLLGRMGMMIRPQEDEGHTENEETDITREPDLLDFDDRQNTGVD